MSDITAKLSAILVGLEDDYAQIIREYLSMLDLGEIKDLSQFESFIENPPETPSTFIFCGNVIKDIPPEEFAQAFRGQFANALVYYCIRTPEAFNKKDLIKNGFHDVFLFPLDLRIFKRYLREIQMQVSNERNYKAVKLLDMSPDTQLEFDVAVFMPVNKKYVRFMKGGIDVGAERLAKLQERKVSNIYVDKQDMQKFYEYSAKILAKLNKGSSMGETEKQEKLENAVRDLFTGIFQKGESEALIQEGKDMLESSQKIVKEFILSTSDSEWYSALSNQVGGEMDPYTQASRVSTYASLFSIGAQIGKPDEIAIAGLFFSLGLADLPLELQTKPYSQMTGSEKELYALYPEKSVKLLKQMKVPVPQKVYDMILHHRERYDGTGFPRGITPPKLSKEDQILGLSLEFDTIIFNESSKRMLTPKEAFEIIHKQGNKFDPNIISALSKMIP